MASGFNPTSTAAKNILAAGYPPDIVLPAPPRRSLWGNYSNSFWEVTQCQWQKRLDPAYDTYGSGTGTYNYVQRLSVSDVGAKIAAFATTGDDPAPADHRRRHDGRAAADRPPRARLRAQGRSRARRRRGNGRGSRRAPAYRLYEVQNGNHIETYQDTFPQLELIEPHAQRAFDLLVQHVEHGVALPPDQCIPRGGAIASGPASAGHCAALFAP